MAAMFKVTHNAGEVISGAQKTKMRLDRGTRRLHNKISITARDNIRANIGQPPFPGYATKGGLAKKTVRSKMKKVGPHFIGRVYVQLTGKQARYALIHEYGGVIRAKRAPYLIFHIPGVGWRRVKKVTIKAKGYFSRGIEKTRQQFSPAVMAKEYD